MRMPVVVILLAVLSRCITVDGVALQEAPKKLLPLLVDDEDQKQALEGLYYFTTGPQWTRSDNWMSNLSYCTWFGVICAPGSTNITSLVLSNNNLVGQMPESLGQLRFLKSLYLDHNKLSGSIPNSIGELWHSEVMHLEHNEITGNFANSFGQLRFLLDLNISHNKITGDLTDSISGMRYLRTMDASYNQLEGQIPYTFQFAGNITYLNFTHNLLSGPIPAYLDKLTLQSLDLSNNQFYSIDSQFQQPPHLSDCDFSKNPIHCPVPSWTVQMCNCHCTSAPVAAATNRRAVPIQ